MSIVLDGTANTVTPLNGALGATTPSTVVATSVNTPNTFGFKNRIINGDMRIDQRNAGASVATPTNTFIVDRFYARELGSGVASGQQSSTAPTGFNKSLLMTVTTADTSLSGTDRYYIRQSIEGFNFADFGFGTASAASATVSFWVRSSVTGSYGFSAMNEAGDRIYASLYTINVANTWEQKTITIPGDTSGTWNGATNGVGIMLNWVLGMSPDHVTSTLNAWTTTASAIAPTGLTQWISTSGATFYITGVQLEKGSTATSFDVRDYGRELIMCQRYLPAFLGGGPLSSAYFYSTTGAAANLPFPVTARVAPTGITVSAVSDFRFDTASVFTPSSLSFESATISTGLITGVVSGVPLNAGGRFKSASDTAKLLFTGCEL